MIRLLIPSLVPVLLVGCFSPKYVDGSLRCEQRTHACPDGYYCADNETCWRTGTAPDLVDAPMPMDDMAEQAADLAMGKPNAAACSSDGDCASTHCVDGVCCNSACTGQCEACDTASTGTCSPVQGPPHGSRGACTGGGSTCGGMCDGTNRTACSYPPTTQICGAACDGHCDGAGTCSAANGTCPNGYACGAGTCKTSCQNNGDCQPNFTCTAPNCVRVPESDCLDGLDNNGDGKVDCDDPTCNGEVACVPAAGTGNELGLISASGCSATGYGVTEPQHQGLSMPACTGCSCSSSILCTENIRMYNANDPSCSTNNYIAYDVVSYPISDPRACVAINSTTYYDYYIGNQTLLSSSCTPAGTPTLADPMWTTTTNFCAAARISTNNCGGDKSKVCAAAPPTGQKLCVRAPGASSGCPVGYTGSSAVYYSGYQKGSCGSCAGCSLLSSSCSGSAEMAFFTDSKCQNGDFGLSPTSVPAGCYSASDGVSKFPHQFAALELAGPGGSSNVTCSSPAVTTNYSSATGASVICCP